MSARLVFYTKRELLVEWIKQEKKASLRCLKSRSNDLLSKNINAIIASINDAYINRSRKCILRLYKKTGYFNRSSRFGVSLIALFKTHRCNEIMMGSFGY